MKIECKLKRAGGTHVDMGTAKYHFAPLEDGAHVANVEDEAHEARFLSISEAYRVYKGSAEGAPAAVIVAATAPAKVVKPYWSDTHPESFDIGGKTYNWTEVLDLAVATSGLSAEDWNKLNAEARADLIDDELDKLAEGKADDGAEQDDDALRAELVAQFEAKFGKKPHHNAGIAKIRADLAED